MVDFPNDYFGSQPPPRGYVKELPKPTLYKMLKSSMESKKDYTNEGVAVDHETDLLPTRFICAWCDARVSRPSNRPGSCPRCGAQFIPREEQPV